MDTEYTKGFRAGMAWREAEIIKLLESEKFILPEGVDEGLTLMPIQEAITLIEGEEQVSEKRKIQPDPNPYIKWWL